MTRLALVCCALGCFAGPVPAQQAAAVLPAVTLPPELDRVLRDYEIAWQARDAAALTALFAPDGFVMAPGRPPARGADAILAYYTGRGGPLSLRAFAWAAEGDTGWIIGGYARAAGQPDIGKFSLTLRRGPAGRWLIVTDMDNGNQ